MSKISQLISCLGNYLTDVLGLNVGLFHLDGKKTVLLAKPCLSVLDVKDGDRDSVIPL